MSTDTILHWLLRTTLEGSALILAVLVIRRVMGNRLTPAWRVTLWSVLALKLLLPAALPTVGLGTVWPNPSSDRVAVTEGSRGFQPTVHAPTNHASRSDGGTRLSNSSTEPGSGVATRHASNGIAERGLKPTATFLGRYAIIMGIWLLGMMTVLSIALVRDFRFRRNLSRLPINRDRQLWARVDDVAQAFRLPRAPGILITKASTVPSVSGLLSPVLLMPHDWDSRFTDTELNAVLRHELLHLKHHDLWWNWCATLVNALHWFNPLVWLVVARCQEDRELRCDERALSVASSDERIAYGRTLLRLAEHFMAPPAIAGVAPCVRNHPLLRQRILMITNPSSHRPWFHALCTLALGVLVMVSFGSARAQEEKPNRTREGERSPSPEATAPRKAGEEKGAVRKGEADGMKKRGDGDGAAKTGARDGDGKKTSAEGDGARKAGTRDGDGGAKRGARDGDGAKKSAEGDGARKTGARDGESGKRGMRDGEGARKSAEGEGSRKSAEGDGARKSGPRDGDAPSTGKALVLRVTDGGDTIVINGEKILHARLRGHLSEFLPEHRGDDVSIEADDDVPFKSVADVLDAARDNGAKKARLVTSSKDK